MPDNEDVITALSVFAVVPVSTLDSSIGWYTRLVGRELGGDGDRRERGKPLLARGSAPRKRGDECR